MGFPALTGTPSKERGGTQSEGPWSRELVKQIAMDIGKEAVHHLEIMYPAAVAACPDTMKLSLRNHIYNNIMAALETTDADAIAARLKRRKALRRADKSVYNSIRSSSSTQ